MSTHELYALVELDTRVISSTIEKVETQTIIRQILRTYESESRADADLELLQKVLPDIKFEVRPIDHIEH